MADRARPKIKSSELTLDEINQAAFAPADGPERWFVLQCAAKREQAAAQWLSMMRFPVFIPWEEYAVSKRNCQRTAPPGL